MPFMSTGWELSNIAHALEDHYAFCPRSPEDEIYATRSRPTEPLPGCV